VLLFEDAAEASAFEVRLSAAHARAARSQVYSAWAPKVQAPGAPRRARPVQLLA